MLFLATVKEEIKGIKLLKKIKFSEQATYKLTYKLSLS